MLASKCARETECTKKGDNMDSCNYERHFYKQGSYIQTCRSTSRPAFRHILQLTDENIITFFGQNKEMVFACF